jgi:hypothetical protein
MTQPKLLKSLYAPANDASILSYSQVRIKKEGNVYVVEPVGSPMSTEQMFALRNKTKDKNPIVREQKIRELEAQIRRELSADGHVFANLGLSCILTTKIQGRDYAILVRSNRKTVWGDFNDRTAEIVKAISGYIESEHTADPIKSLEKELSEELLFLTKDGKLLPGFIDGRPLPRPYENMFAYSDEAKFNIAGPGAWKMPSHRKIIIGGKEANGNPAIYFHPGTDSAQLLFNYSIEFTPNESIIEKLGLSFDHSEDKRSEDKMHLNTFYHHDGLLLIELENGKPTISAYSVYQGKLKAFPDGVELSESFAPRKDSIVNSDSIRLDVLVDQFSILTA